MNLLEFDRLMLQPSDLPAMVIFKALKDVRSDREKVRIEAREFLLSEFACWYTSLLGVRREYYLEWIKGELNNVNQ